MMITKKHTNGEAEDESGERESGDKRQLARQMRGRGSGRTRKLKQWTECELWMKGIQERMKKGRKEYCMQ